MFCITSRKLLSPMYLMCDYNLHTYLLWRHKNNIFISLFAYHKYEKHKNILILLQDKWV